MLSMTADNRLQYAIEKNGKALVAPSPLGLIFSDHSNFDSDLQIVRSERQSQSEQWTPRWGTDSLIHNEYETLSVYLVNSENRQLKVVFKVFDDGVGFRYEIPKQQGLDSLMITNELTSFNFVRKATAWSIPANYESYEFLYRTSSLDAVENANTPLTFKAEDGTHVSVHEANLTNYPGMTLVNTGGTSFECDLVPWPDGIKVKTTAPMKSPWRTIMIADDAAGLLASHLIQNLNEPSKISDPSWIEPVKYVGIWWGMHLGAETWTMGPYHGATTENMKRYIDFASMNQINAVLAEGWNQGWENWGKPKAFDQTTPYEDFDFDQVVQYARERNIQLMGHHETGGDIYTYEQRLDTAMNRLADHGIKLLKTGYAGPIPDGHFHHGQRMVSHYRKVVETAAKYNIMLNVHEPIKPTGISRTWPNMMTREGVRGMEWNAWSEGNPPEHHVIIPFTRGLAGPIDYTPGVFDIKYQNRERYQAWNGNDKGNSRVNTTLAKQLALWITLYSPMQMASDQIHNYEDQPAFSFFENLPPQWQESRILAAAIGDYLAIARRNGKSWWIGATSDEQERVLLIPLDFLENGVYFKATIYKDNSATDLDNNPTAYDITTEKVTNNTILRVEMAAGGGQAVRITPIDQKLNQNRTLE